jgi:phosphoribosyl 1,2-cyclic phosphodiesterase/ActR/RegA family two-component response regulator
MKTVLVIEAQQALRSRVTPGLDAHEWSVLDANDQENALALARQHQPELILCDWQHPWSDIGRSCRNLAHHHGASIRRPILIATGSGKIAEKIAALESGADEYIANSVDSKALVDFLGRLSAHGKNGDTSKLNGANGGPCETRLRFWGVRGSIASPGPETVRCGGNTSCIEIRVGGEILILDAGTGIRKLGRALMEEFKDRPAHLNLLISHSHWDHIQGFPFFQPAYHPNFELTIYGYEGAQLGLQSTLASQMENRNFPVAMRQMSGNITIRELKEMSFRVGAVAVKAHFVNHPGVCVGYRIFTPGGSISYLPDVELFQQRRTSWKTASGQAGTHESSAIQEEDRSTLEFIRGSDVLILDSQYDPAEYNEKIGWGHSCFEDSVTIAMQGGVQRLFMFHHDPDHADEKISSMEAHAGEMAQRAHSPIHIEAAREGCEVVLPALRTV